MTNQEFIDAWESGQEVTVIELGGLGLGYEIAIWEFAVKALNVMVNIKPFNWKTFDELSDDEKKKFWEEYRNYVERGAYGRGDEKGPLAETLDLLGLSGAQWSAGWNAASVISKNGYDAALLMVDEERRIKLSKGGLDLNPKELVKIE